MIVFPSLKARILRLYSFYTTLTIDQIMGALHVGQLAVHNALCELVSAGHLIRNRRNRSARRPRAHTVYALPGSTP